jgi:hypothetical protein
VKSCLVFGLAGIRATTPIFKIAAQTEEPTSLRQQTFGKPRVRILLGVPFCGSNSEKALRKGNGLKREPKLIPAEDDLRTPA